MYEIKHGDCLELLKTIPDQTFDAIITDPPYGLTDCKWDTAIPLEPLWVELKRVIKPRGAIVLHAQQPFTTTLISSNRKWYRYNYVWVKGSVTGFLNAKVCPLRKHEDILVFGKGAVNYYPVMRKGKIHIRGGNKAGTTVYNKFDTSLPETVTDEYYPTSVLEFDNSNGKGKKHPTQKPLPLMEYLVKTYTKEGDRVLDFACGSGSTGVAAVKLGRDFIGMEKEECFVNTCRQRIEEAIQLL